MTRLEAPDAAELRWAVLNLDEAEVDAERADLERRIAARTHRDTPLKCARRRRVLLEAERHHAALKAATCRGIA